jgi:putative RNA 2'-phosphotransferase
MKTRYVKFGKFLSYLLRHKPEAIGLKIDEQGWADLDELVDCAVRHGKSVDRTKVLDVVASDDK